MENNNHMKGLSVKEMINLLDYGQLVKLQKDLASGGHHLHNLVRQRAHQLETKDRKVCAFCGTQINEEASAYTLLFGPSDFRKKASFCALDCLESFNKNLRMFSERRNKHD
jgi:hypothetical protein